MKFDPSKNLSASEIRERINAIAGGSADLGPSLPEAAGPPAFRFADPLHTAVGPLIEVLSDDDEKFEFGIIDLDLYLRGMRAKDLVLVTAFPHSGKTQLILSAIVNNPEKRILFLSLDDAREAVAAKLICMTHGLNGAEFEAEIRAGNEEYLDLLRTTPQERFPNLLITDAPMNVSDLPVALEEATKFWGADPHLIALDYVGLLRSDAHGVEDGFASISGKMKELKGFAKTLPCPLLVVHQGTRGGAKPGTRITLTSMGFAGEQEATIVLGLRRKRDDEERDQSERHRLRHTVTIDIPKLKRIGGRLTGPEGIDLYLEPSNGLIRHLYDTDFD